MKITKRHMKWVSTALLLVVMGIATAIGAMAVTSDGLLGQFNFDDVDTQGNVSLDSSGYGNDATIFVDPSGTVSTGVPGYIGEAYNFSNSEDDWVVLLDQVLPGNQFSVCAAITSDFSYLSNNGYFIATSPPTGVHTFLLMRIPDPFFIQRERASAQYYRVNTAMPAFGIWEHICYTYNGGSNFTDTRFFIDGVYQPPENTNGPQFNSVYNFLARPLTVGGSVTGGNAGNGFDGYIDEVLVFNRTLSDQEVSELYDLYSSGERLVVPAEASSGGSTRYLVNETGDVIGVSVGGAVTLYDAPKKAGPDFLLIGGDPGSFNLVEWFKDLFSGFQGWFVK